jgi:hypothetical protein
VYKHAEDREIMEGELLKTWPSPVALVLHDHLSPTHSLGYNDSLQEEMNVDCPPGQYFIQDGNEDEDKKACQFKRSFLKNCSGLEDPTFGYSTGQPCILLKMNRVH